MASLHSFYEDRIAAHSGELRIVQKKISLTALLRLISFCGLVVTVYFLIRGAVYGLGYSTLLPALFLLAGYIILVNRSQQLKNRQALLEKLLFINTNELQLLNHEPNRLPDGQGFLRNEGYLDDLDIFGKGSLFHLLNRTTSSYGSAALAGLLSQPLLSAVDIREQQEAIRALAGQVDKRQLILAHGLLNDEKTDNLHSLADWMTSSTPLFRKKWVMIALWAVVVYNSAFFIFWVLGGDYRPLLGGVLVSWALNGLYTRFFSQANGLTRKNAVLDQYAMTLGLFNTMDNGRSVMLGRLQRQTQQAHQAISRLARLSDYLDRQLNPTAGIVLNSLFVYNLRGQVSLERWKHANKTHFPEWIDAVGRIECLNSLAAFAFNNPGYCYPSPQSPSSDPAPSPDPAGATSVQHFSTPTDPRSPAPSPTNAPSFIVAEQLAHPMIPTAGCVANDLSIGRNDRIMLVTGSNMSGKTTFLRTVGVNLLLAQCGAPVCAASFSFTPMQILSSLRISDSLQENTSYFMAELKKLQQIIHSLESGRPSLVLIDEILRGTNSEDKTYGSEQFIRKLLQYSCLSLFATHDLSLGKLEEEQPGLVSNYCFESVIEQGELHFDYRLQRGVARNRNASFLMKKMEII